MRVVVALGGNALLRRGEPLTAENQKANIARACEALAPLALEHECQGRVMADDQGLDRIDQERDAERSHEKTLTRGNR